MSDAPMNLGQLERPVYRRDGQVKWGRYVVALGFAMMVAVGMGLLLTWAFDAGWYFMIVVPLASALPVAGAAYLVVKLSHCRNLGMAILVGLISGLVLYPGWFHVQLVSVAGLQNAHRVDLLPRYILFRLRNDAAGEIGKPANAPNVVSNSVFFAVELFLVVGLTTGVAAYRASRVYCTHCGEWGRLAIHSGPPGSANLIYRLLSESQLQQLPVIAKVAPNVQEPSASITVEACRKAGSNNSCCAFLTLKENPGTKNKAKASQQNLLHQTAITRHELGYLATKIEGLAPLAPPGFVPDEVEAEIEVLADIAPATKHQIGRVETVSPEAADSIYCARSATILAALSFIPVIAFVAGCALLFFAWRAWPAQAGQASWLAPLACLFTGLVALVFGIVVCWVNVDYFNCRRKFQWVRDLIAIRHNAIVSPLDPRSFFVEIMPRENWTNQVTRHPLDGGFVVVEESPPALLFEGLRQRYRIPGEAILSCETENTMPDATANFSFHATVVKAQVAVDPHGSRNLTPQVLEIPFMIRPSIFAKTNGRVRKANCDRLAESIQRIMG